MPSKEDVLESLTKKEYSLFEVKALVSSVRLGSQPNTVKKGDVFVDRVGKKSRPCVVYKVVGLLAYAIPLSTTEDELTLCTKRVSRFENVQEGKSFFSKGIVVSKTEYVKENFCFVYEHKREIDNAVKQLKKLI